MVLSIIYLISNGDIIIILTHIILWVNIGIYAMTI